MNTLTEFENYFYEKGLTFNRDEVLTLITGTATGNLGPIKTTDPAPADPLLNQSVELIGTGTGSGPSGSYTHLLGAEGVPIVIPAAAANTAILNAKAVWNGSYWIALYQITSIPFQDVSNFATIAQVAPLIPVAPVADMLVSTDNLLNNADLVFGGWSKTGGQRISTTELRTPLILIDPAKANITFSGGFAIGAAMARFVFFDASKVFVSYTDGIDATAVTSPIPATAKYVGISVAVSSVMGADPTNTQFKLTAMLNYGTNALPWSKFAFALDNSRIKSLDLPTVVRGYELYNGSGKNKFNKDVAIPGKFMMAASGALGERSDSAVSPLIPVKAGDFGILSGLTNTTITVRYVDAAGNPLKPLRAATGVEFPSYSYIAVVMKAPVGAVAFQFMWKYNNIGVSDAVQFEKVTTSAYAPTAYEAFIKKISSEQVEGASSVVVDLSNYTQNGGSTKTAQDLDTAATAAAGQAAAAISSASSALTKAAGAQSTADAAASNILTRIFDTPQIKDSAINLNKISQSLIDYINASGGGNITNLADDEDITTILGQLKLKDGADGYARVRIKGTVAAQITDIQTKAGTFGSIIIKDVIDLVSGTGGRSILTLPDNTRIKFVGNGMLKNTYLYGKNLIIEASRVKIFDNVQFFVYGGGTVQIPSTNNNILTVTLPSASAVDFFDKKNKVVHLAASVEVVNPMDTKPMHAKLADLPLIVNESGVWKLKVGSTVYFTLTNSGSNVVIPISDKFIFFDKDTNAVLAGGAIVAPATVKGTYLVNYSRTVRSTIYNEIFPEWWGAKADGVTDNTDAFNMCIRVASAGVGGNISFAGSGLPYMVSGGVVLLGNINLNCNFSKLKLMNSALNHLIIHDNIELLNRCNISGLYLDGNRANQSVGWNCISIGWNWGQPFYSQDASYSWSESAITNVWTEFAHGTGFYVAVPGDLNLIGCNSRYNDLDGFFWEKEHLKFVECMTWQNERHGIYTNGGNHFSIIGGKNAHNGGNNINLVNAFEFQISAAAMTDAGSGTGIHMNISNCYGFNMNNLRCIGPAAMAIKIDAASSKGMIIGIIDKGNTAPYDNQSSTVVVSNIVRY